MLTSVRALTMALSLALLAACASSPTTTGRPLETARALLDSLRMPMDIPELDTGVLLRPGPELQIAFNQFPRGHQDEFHLRRLVQQITAHPQPMQYRATVTQTADEAYRSRQANCLGYAALMVTALRAAGFDARFQRVHLPLDWDMQGDTAIAGLHINTVVRLGGRDVEIEWGGVDTGRALRKRILSDAEAEAEFHNNLGVAAMLDQQPDVAYAHFQAALWRSPEQPHLWVNLAALLRRVDDRRGQEAALQHALRHKPDDLIALHAMSNLLEGSGRQGEAQRLQQRVARFRARNPWYRYARARHLAAQGDIAAALYEIRQAIRLQQDRRFDLFLDELLATEPTLAAR